MTLSPVYPLSFLGLLLVGTTAHQKPPRRPVFWETDIFLDTTVWPLLKSFYIPLFAHFLLLVHQFKELTFRLLQNGMTDQCMYDQSYTQV